MVKKGSLIVTGGSSGIGQAVLSTLAEEFAEDKILNIDIRDAQRSIDVRDYGAVSEAISNVVSPREANYLFSGAGVIFFVDPTTKKEVDFAAAPVEQLKMMVDINFVGQINVLHAFVNAIREHNAVGNIVVVSSISAFFSGGPNMAVYDATKAAISALAKRLVPYKNLRINIIDPGSIQTGIGSLNPDFSYSPEGAAIFQRGQDADDERLGATVGVGQLVEVTKFLFFADHGMNGTEVTVDGGLTLMGREGY